MDLSEVLMELSAACGVSGDEGAAAKTAEQYLKPLVDETFYTTLGNLVGIRRSKHAKAKTVLLDAHLDEVGLMVTGREKGLLKIADGVGGVDPRLLPGLQVKVLTEPGIPGVISLPEGDVTMENLRIDCGLTEAEAEKIPLGTRVAYGTKPWKSGDRIFGKSLDNRACFTALLRAMELTKDENLPVHVAVLGSVQEEIGGAGALTGTYAIKPDVALVTDVTFGDSPDTPKDAGFPLNSGAAIGASPVLDRVLTKKLREIAAQKNISHVIEVMPGGTGTNSMHTQIAGEGVPSALISMPLRYMHTPVEEICLCDVEAVAQLVAEFLRSFGEEA